MIVGLTVLRQLLRFSATGISVFTAEYRGDFTAGDGDLFQTKWVHITKNKSGIE